MRRGVLFIGAFPSPESGHRGVCEDLALRLSSRGWDVLVASSLEGRIQRIADICRTAWQRRREYAVAHIDVYSGPAFAWAEMAASVVCRAGRPYVLTLRGGNLPSFARRWPGRVRRLFARAAAITAPSPYLSEQMCGYRGDIRLLPNPVNTREYEFLLRSEPAPRLIWLRAFHRIYNPGLAVDVAARLLAEHPNVQLVMVGRDKGDGSLQAVQERATMLGLNQRLTLPGGVPKSAVPRWLNRGDIFLNTADIDNTPVSVIEAMTCGLCVVSTNAGGMPYLVEHEREGLLVPPGDAEAMAEAAHRLLADPGLAERLSRGARVRAEQYDWPRILPQWEALLTTAAAGGAP